MHRLRPFRTPDCYKSVGFKENGVREEYSIAGEKWIDIEMETHKK